MDELNNRTPQQTYELITANINNIKDKCKSALKEALFTENFIDYIKEKHKELSSLFEMFEQYKADRTDRVVIDKICEFSDNSIIVSAFVYYIVVDKKIAVYQHSLQWQLLTSVQLIDEKTLKTKSAIIESAIDCFFLDGSIEKIAESNPAVYEQLASMMYSIHERLIFWFMQRFQKISSSQLFTTAELNLFEVIIRQRKGIGSGNTDISYVMQKLEEVNFSNKNMTMQLIQIIIFFLRYKPIEKTDALKQQFVQRVEQYIENIQFKEIAYRLLSVLGAYHYLTHSEVERLLHRSLSSKAHFMSAQDLFYKRSIEWVMQEIKGSYALHPPASLVSWFRYLFLKLSVVPDFELSVLLYDFHARYPAMLSWKELINIKIKITDSSLVQHVCDFVFAISFSEQDITAKKTNIGRLFSCIVDKLLLLRELKSGLDVYFEKLSITQKQRDEFLILSSLFDKTDEGWEIIIGIETELNNINVSEESAPLVKAVKSLPDLSFSPQRLRSSTGSLLFKRKATANAGRESPIKKSASSSSCNQMLDVAIRPNAISKQRSSDAIPTIPNMKRARAVPVVATDISFNAFSATIEPDDDRLYRDVLFRKHTHADDNTKEPNKTQAASIPKPYLSEDAFEKTMRNNRAAGIWGEAALFFNLKRKYMKKYNAVEINTTDKNKIMMSGVHRTKGEIRIEITWPNYELWHTWRERKAGDFIDPATQPYDMEIKKVWANGQKQRQVELKSTASAHITVATMTGNEFDFMRQVDKNYRVYRCYLAGTPNAFFVKYKQIYNDMLAKKVPIQKIDFVA